MIAAKGRGGDGGRSQKVGGGYGRLAWRGNVVREAGMAEMVEMASIAIYWGRVSRFTANSCKYAIIVGGNLALVPNNC